MFCFFNLFNVWEDKKPKCASSKPKPQLLKASAKPFPFIEMWTEFHHKHIFQFQCENKSKKNPFNWILLHIQKKLEQQLEV